LLYQLREAFKAIGVGFDIGSVFQALFEDDMCQCIQ